MPAIRPKCFFIALIFAWVVAIYLPSAAIALAGLSPVATGQSLPAATFDVANEVAPAAKIGFALILSLLLFARRKLVQRLAPAADLLVGAAAMLFVVALLPAQWSRGFGIGLSGIRFDPAPLTIYLVGGALAGLTFHLSEARCTRRGKPDGGTSAT